MSYHTILVHLTNEKRAPELLHAATSLAAHAKHSHVIGLHIMPPLIMPAEYAVTFGAEVMDIQEKQNREVAERLKGIFDRSVAAAPFVTEWRLENGNPAGVAHVALKAARTADLVIASQLDTDLDPLGTHDVPQRLAIESGRPVLLIPNVGSYPTIGKRVAVAWNGSREAARATFDALPILKAADSVLVLTVNEPARQGEPQEIPGADICQALARHGVKCEARTSINARIGIGNELLSRLADESADMLVMGAYGHSRFREFVFGGATRDLLQHMTVPVLMSH